MITTSSGGASAFTATSSVVHEQKAPHWIGRPYTYEASTSALPDTGR